MAARYLAILILAGSAAFAQEPRTLPPPVGSRSTFGTGSELPPFLAVPEPVAPPKKSCKSCPNDYHPSHSYLPDHTPDAVAENFDGDCQPRRRAWAELSAFWGKCDNLSVAERKYTYGLQGSGGYWLDDASTMGVVVGFFNAHASFRTTQPGPSLIDSPVTLSAGDVSARLEIFTQERFRVDALAGYQYVRFHERLLTGSQTTYEEIDNRNSINAGRLGLVGTYAYGPYFTEVIAAVALGNNETSVELNGVNTSDSMLCYVPQLSGRMAYQMGEGLWFTLGYSLFYLSDVQRPNTGESSFFLHGITIGLEKRF